MHLKLFMSNEYVRILHLVGNCTSFPNSVSNIATLVAWTQPWWVGILIPENLVNSTNQGCIYCLFFHHTSSWASHYLPSLGLRSPTCGQPTAWMLGEVSRVSSKLSWAFPKPLCWDNFWCSPIVLLCPPPTTETVVPAPIPKSHAHSQSILLGAILEAPAQSWGRHICRPGDGAGVWSMRWGKQQRGRVLDIRLLHTPARCIWSHKWTSEPGDECFSSVLCSECYFWPTHTGIAGWRTEQVQGNL